MTSRIKCAKCGAETVNLEKTILYCSKCYQSHERLLTDTRAFTRSINAAKEKAQADLENTRIVLVDLAQLAMMAATNPDDLEIRAALMDRLKMLPKEVFTNET